jgi:hypothetical protein
MLAAKCTNFVPAAIDAGLLPLLSTVLVRPVNSCSARGAVLRCLRLTTDKSFGARKVADDTQLMHSVLDACAAAAAERLVHKGWHTEDKVRAVTDAMHIAANILAAGEHALQYLAVHCILLRS